MPQQHRTKITSPTQQQTSQGQATGQPEHAQIVRYRQPAQSDRTQRTQRQTQSSSTPQPARSRGFYRRNRHGPHNSLNHIGLSVPFQIRSHKLHLSSFVAQRQDMHHSRSASLSLHPMIAHRTTPLNNTYRRRTGFAGSWARQEEKIYNGVFSLVSQLAGSCLSLRRFASKEPSCPRPLRIFVLPLLPPLSSLSLLQFQSMCCCPTC